MSATWADRLAARVDQDNQDRKTQDALKLRRDELLRSQGGGLWSGFVDEGRQGVNVVARRGKDNITCFEPNSTTFKVENVTYPAISICAKLFVDGIELEYYRRKDATSEAENDQKWVEFGLDDNDHLVLTCDGHRLLGKDELLEFALGPPFRLRP